MKKKLKSTLQKIYTKKFPFEPTPSKTVFIHLQKFHREGKVSWKVQEIQEDSFEGFGKDITVEERYTQVIVRGTIEQKDDLHYSVIDIEIESKSIVEKPKDKIAKYITRLWDICYPETTSHWIEDTLTRDDITVTTVWGKQKAGHLSVSESGVKLGVDWKTWHYRTPEQKLIFLVHELTHIVHSHHKKSFFISLSEAIKNTFSNKTEIELWFGVSLDWDRVKAFTLNEPKKQSSELSLRNAQHRLEARENVVREMSQKLNYDFQTANRLYLNPPIREIKMGYFRTTEETDYSLVPLERLQYDCDLTQSEINQKITDYLVNHEKHGFKYTTEHLPTITEDYKVIENSWYVKMQKIMKVSKWKNQPEEMRDELNIQIPCVYM